MAIHTPVKERKKYLMTSYKKSAMFLLDLTNTTQVIYSFSADVTFISLSVCETHSFNYLIKPLFIPHEKLALLLLHFGPVYVVI